MAYTKPYSGEYRYISQDVPFPLTKHELHSTWRMMNIRCYDTRHKAFHRYGERDIDVIQSWRWDNPLGFSNFIRDMGNRPPGYTLDRINNNLGYSKENCQWASKKQQQNNIGIGLANKTGEIGVCYDNYHNCWIAQIALFGETRGIGRFNEEDKQLAADRYEMIKQVKIESGDQAAYEFYLSIKDLTPAGKQKRRNKTSQYYGVCKGRGEKWRAFTNEYVNGKLKQNNLGSYETEIEAYNAVLERLGKAKEAEIPNTG